VSTHYSVILHVLQSLNCNRKILLDSPERSVSWMDVTFADPGKDIIPWTSQNMTTWPRFRGGKFER
jgi:hypothetical protein